MNGRRFVWLVAMHTAVAATAACTAELWVEGAGGSDGNPGTREQPLATIPAAVEMLQPGTTLHVLPGDKPYPGNVRLTASGTPELPIVVDGHGSVLSGRRSLPAEAWTDCGDGVFSRLLPNNAWGMEHHWEGGFPLVWFEGKPARNVATRGALEPGCYSLHKNRKEAQTDSLHNTLFIRPPAGCSLAQVESIVEDSGIYVGGNYVTVRNFVTEYGGRDGFATHRNKGVAFENVEARYFMDQGTSQHGAEVTVRNAYFHHNAGCGVVDVYPEAKVRYENCLIEADTWRGGVEFHSGQFEMVGCVVRGNPGKALSVNKGARVTLRDCLLLAGDQHEAVGIRLAEGCSLVLDHCTLEGFATGLEAVFTAATRLTMERCSFRHCTTNLRFTARRGAGEPPVSIDEGLVAAGNRYGAAPFALIRLEQSAADNQWNRKEARFEPAKAPLFFRKVGTATDALVEFPDANDDLLARGKQLRAAVGPESAPGEPQ